MSAPFVAPHSPPRPAPVRLLAPAVESSALVGVGSAPPVVGPAASSASAASSAASWGAAAVAVAASPLPPLPIAKSFSASPPAPYAGLSLSARAASVLDSLGSSHGSNLVRARSGVLSPGSVARRRSAGAATLPNPRTCAYGTGVHVGMSPHVHTARHAHLFLAPLSGTHTIGAPNESGGSGGVLGSTDGGAPAPHKLSMSASPPLVPRIRMPARASSPPPLSALSQPSTASVTPLGLGLSRGASNEGLSSLMAATTTALRTPSPHLTASSRPGSGAASRRGSHSMSRPESRNGSLTHSVHHHPSLLHGLPITSRPSSSRPSSRPVSRGNSTHSSRASSRRGSLEGGVMAVAPLFVAGADLLDADALAMHGGAGRRMREARLAASPDPRESSEEESNTSLPGLDEDFVAMADQEQGSQPRAARAHHIYTASSEIGSDEDGETETLAALRAMPPRRLMVSTDDGPSDVNAPPSTRPASFKVPSLILPTPTSATVANSARASGSLSCHSQATPAGPVRSRFLDLKLVCPSPERAAPPATREDKLLFFSRQCSILTDYLAVGSRLIAQDWRQFVANGITHVVNCAGDICDNYFEAVQPESHSDDGDENDDGDSQDGPNGSSPRGVRQTRPVKYLRLFLLDTQDEDLMCVLYPVIEFVDAARREGRVSITPEEVAMRCANAKEAAAADDDEQMNQPTPQPAHTPDASVDDALGSSIHPRVLIHCQQGVSRSTALCIAYLMLDRGLDYEDAYSLVRGIRGICRPNFGFIAQLKAWKTRLDGWPATTDGSNGGGGGPRPILYRVAPHCSRDRRIVIKMVDRLGAGSLDSRSVFVLVTRDLITTWIGARVLPAQEACYLRQTTKHIARLRRYEHAPHAEVTLRQKDEQALANEFRARTGSATSLYEVRPEIPLGTDEDDDELHPCADGTTSANTSMSSSTPELFERSPSQTLFLATLMSPTTLHSLNLHSSNQVASPPLLTRPMEATNSNSHSPVTMTQQHSLRVSSPLLKPSSRQHVSLCSSPAGPVPSSLPTLPLGTILSSPTQTTAHASVSADSESSGVCTPVSPTLTDRSFPTVSVLAADSPPDDADLDLDLAPPAAALSLASSFVSEFGPDSWQCASLAFWRLLNGSPEADLVLDEYDEDYPTHEWMAMHLAAQNAATIHDEAEAARRRHRSTGHEHAPTGAVMGAHVASAVNGHGHKHPPHHRYHTHTHTTHHHHPTHHHHHLGTQSHHHHPHYGHHHHHHHHHHHRSAHRFGEPRPSSTSTCTSSTTMDDANAAAACVPTITTSTFVSASLVADAASNLSPDEFHTRHEWLVRRWQAIAGDDDETRIMAAFLAAVESTRINVALVADNLDCLRGILEVPNDATPPLDRQLLLRQAALCGSANIMEYLLVALGLDYLWCDSVLLSYAAASNNLKLALKVALEVARGGGRMGDDIYRLANSFEVSDLIADVFHQHAAPRMHAHTPETSETPVNGVESQAEILARDAPPFLSPPPLVSVVAVPTLPVTRHRHHRSRSYDGDDDDEDTPMGLTPDDVDPTTEAVPLSARLLIDDDDAEDMDVDGEADNTDAGAASETHSEPSSPAVLNPLTIGLGDPVPVGFVANRAVGRHYSRDDSSSSDEELACVDAASLERGGRSSHVSHHGLTLASRSTADAAGGPVVEDDEAGASSLKPVGMIASLFSVPDFDELTSFDLDDLVHTSTLVLEWRRGERRRTIDDEDEEEVAEVRNLRPSLSGLAHTNGTPKSAAPSPTSAAARAPPDSSPEPPRIYHVWFGAAVPHDGGDRLALARDIVREFRVARGLFNDTAGDTLNVTVELDAHESEQFLAAFDEE